jgi:hypothetical protein
LRTASYDHDENFRVAMVAEKTNAPQFTFLKAISKEFDIAPQRSAVVVAINGSQWAGDYMSAGIGSIAMDLNNLGMTDLTIRLLFEDPIGGPPADEAVTNFGAFLPVGSGWMHFVFPISPSALTAVDGSPAAALSNATLMRIINAPTVGDATRQLGVLGVNNIASQSAAAVPEPSTVLFALTGFASLVFLRPRR